jgi:hypothetical protein
LEGGNIGGKWSKVMLINHHNQAIGCWIGLEKLTQKEN